MAKNESIWTPDDALFREATEGVTPLAHDQVEPFRRRLPPRPLSRGRNHASEPRDVWLDEARESDIAPEGELYFARPGVQHRLMRDLMRGRMEIGRTLDLHGLSATHARERLTEFLQICHQRRIRCVHIIHGKGYGSANRRPVLKQKLDLWLRQRRDVLGFCSAPPRHGGTGAVYVLLSGRSQVRS